MSGTLHDERALLAISLARPERLTQSRGKEHA